MNPRILIMVTGDPRQSGKPAEALRIAAGVAVWERVEVTLYFRGAAVLALAESPDNLIDSDNYTQYWPLLAEAGRPVYAQQGAATLASLGQPPIAFAEINDDQLARLAAEQNCVMRF